jgi:hypothetical protein
VREQDNEKTEQPTTSSAPGRRARIPALALASVALLAVLTGCGDDDSDSDSDSSGRSQTTPTGSASSPPPTPPAGVLVNVGTTQAGELSSAAALRGDVTISDSGCIHVQPQGKDAAPVDVLWPAGYELVQVGTNPMEIRNAEGEPVARIGTAVQVGGEVLEGGATAEAACEVTEDGAMFQITDEVEPLPGS